MPLTLADKDEILEILEGADEGLTRASQALQEAEIISGQKNPSLAKKFERIESEVLRLTEWIDQLAITDLSHTGQ
jgi:hypothetical protein